MRHTTRQDAVAALIAGAMIVLALMAVFAVELSDNQSQSRSDIARSAHQRAVLVAGLIDAIFGQASHPSAAPPAPTTRPGSRARRCSATRARACTSRCWTPTVGCWRIPAG